MRRTARDRARSWAGFQTAAKLGAEGCRERARRAAMARYRPEEFATRKAAERRAAEEREVREKARLRIDEVLADPVGAGLGADAAQVLEYARIARIVLTPECDADGNAGLRILDGADRLSDVLRNALQEHVNEIAAVLGE
jgi:hypothetical protein